MSSRNQADSESLTSLSLLSRVKTGDGKAWDQLVRDYGPLVQEWTIRSRVPAQDVADVVQDVLQSVARSINRFHRDQSGDSFRKWLRVITTNHIRNYYRRKRELPIAQGGTTAWRRIQHHAQPVRTGSVGSQDFVLSAATIPKEIADKVKQQVKPQTWQAFWATVIEERPAADVADELKMSVWSVYQARSRILARFRNQLNAANRRHKKQDGD